MDLSAAFSKAVSTRAPHVRKVFDRFHVRKLAKTVKMHKDGILAYVETGLSNGVVPLGGSRWLGADPRAPPGWSTMTGPRRAIHSASVRCARVHSAHGQ